MATTPRLSPRKLMELAVEVMHQSVPENRPDGSPSPSVGAILLRPDGTIETAARGELRGGNHAEFILLERKCFKERLDGCVLFTTLEPCMDRKEPKKGCAKHIVSARIREVYVGVEDDNPTVAGKGIEYLRQHGVVVHMFERDLQEEILAANAAFFEWARRQPPKEEDRPPKLSRYEDPLVAVSLGDFSDEALEMYRTRARIAAEVSSEEFSRLLYQQGLLARESERWVPTGFGLLLFGKDPRSAMPQAGLLGTIHYPDGKEETRDFDGPQVLAPEQALQWLRDKLPNPIDRSDVRRRETNAGLFQLVREGVVNALVHRDYEITGGKCQLVVTPDTVVIKSPGAPVKPITLEQLQSFSAPMISRNPVLHYVFARMGMAEERGLGLKSMRGGAESAGLPLPKYTWDNPYLVLTLFQNREAATRALPPSVLEALTDSQRNGWQWLAVRGKAKASEYAEAMQVEDRTGRRHLNRFLELGLVKKTGSGPSTEYEVV
jgi:ATP-dependent DNA helicase RecG